jgi:hypothetical protein
MASTLSIKAHFRKLRDPRRRHGASSFLDVIVMAICAVIGNAEIWRAIALWDGPTRRVKTVFDPPQGRPGPRYVSPAV